jgi:hypothetical protein
MNICSFFPMAEWLPFLAYICHIVKVVENLFLNRICKWRVADYRMWSQYDFCCALHLISIWLWLRSAYDLHMTLSALCIWLISIWLLLRHVCDLHMTLAAFCIWSPYALYMLLIPFLAHALHMPSTCFSSTTIFISPRKIWILFW